MSSQWPTEIEMIADIPTLPPPRMQEYIDTSRLKVEKLTHPSGSMVLKRDFSEDLLNIRGKDESAIDQALEKGVEPAAKESGEKGKGSKKLSCLLPFTEKTSLDTLEYGTTGTSIEDDVNRQMKRSRAADVSVLQSRKTEKDRGHCMSVPLLRRESNGSDYEQVSIPGERPRSTKDFRIRRQSPTSTKQPFNDSSMTFESKRAWVDDLMDENSSNWSDESVVGSDGLTALYSAPIPKFKQSRTPPKKPSGKSRKGYQQPRPQTPQHVRPGTPTTRPTSPPIHRNTADTRKPLEDKERDDWTLYNLSCWTNKNHLKTLLKGPKFEFRTSPHGGPFLTNVSQQMLEHFCGKDHLARILRDYSLRPENRKEEDGNVLIFPEILVDKTAIMRIVRYMRRCCMRTTTVMKPQFQLRAPPSLEANIETIRACNVFGLYADARRIQRFLTDKKIPGGKVTMEDVETIWEGYDGKLRDSMYTDALLTHIIYNVLGSDSIDREDFMVLLEQEEFAGLRELVGTELGIKKRAAEQIDIFKMRKGTERKEKEDRAKGKGKQLNTLERLRAEKGRPMVQGRLLRVLSTDALFEIDSTADLRYKRLHRKSTPQLSVGNNAKDMHLDSASLYNYAVRDMKGEEPTADIEGMPTDSLSELEEKGLSPRSELTTHSNRRPAAPTPSGHPTDIDESETLRTHDSSESRPAVPPKDHPAGIRDDEDLAPGPGMNGKVAKFFGFTEFGHPLSHSTNPRVDNPFPLANVSRDSDTKRVPKPYRTDQNLEKPLPLHPHQRQSYTGVSDDYVTMPSQQPLSRAEISHNTRVPSATHVPPNRPPQRAPRAASFPVPYPGNELIRKSEISIGGKTQQGPVSGMGRARAERSALLTRKEKPNMFKESWRRMYRYFVYD
ncbi:hypothetical protein N0V90_010960 [Kalmusia sp. IMI 367209]|nr:hypothetical protein N0V90_010960 [Kalmusia sp. IMI 367209]